MKAVKVKINKKRFAIPTLVIGIGIALIGFSSKVSSVNIAKENAKSALNDIAIDSKIHIKGTVTGA